jgi:hypothetical protein
MKRNVRQENEEKSNHLPPISAKFIWNGNVKCGCVIIFYFLLVLLITEAVAEIIEAPDLHINEGSTLRLECKLKRATENPLYVFW